MTMRKASYLIGLLAAVAFLPQANGGVHITSKESLGVREVLI